MIDLQNTHHHVEFINLPELKPTDLFWLFMLTKFVEPYTNRVAMMCEVQTVSSGKLIKSEIKSVDVRAGEIPELLGCSPMTAQKLMKTLRETNIVKKHGKTFFVNPNFVRVHNALPTKNTAAIFNHGAEELPEDV